MGYFERAKEKLNALVGKEYTLLAIESSCDETAVSVLRGRKVLSNIISSQIEIHRLYGGVVPEIASRNHITAIDNLVVEALSVAQVAKEDLDVIAVTYGAGLLGALLVGVSYAKAFAYALDLPLIAVDHIKGHIFANFIDNDKLCYPFICLLASGGHTSVLKVNGYNDMKTLGTTVDDAAGEAFDKVARVLGLPYPGGPEIQKCATGGSPSIKMPRAFKGEDTLNFSYSGLKTAVINYVHNASERGETVVAADVACSFQKEATDVLVDHAILAAKRENINVIALAGGVGANAVLRETLTLEGKKNGITVYLPDRKLCTDNGAMIAMAAHFAIEEGEKPVDLTLDAKPARSIF